jgi:hypothetical protein
MDRFGITLFLLLASCSGHGQKSAIGYDLDSIIGMKIYNCATANLLEVDSESKPLGKVTESIFNLTQFTIVQTKVIDSDDTSYSVEVILNIDPKVRNFAVIGTLSKDVPFFAKKPDGLLNSLLGHGFMTKITFPDSVRGEIRTRSVSKGMRTDAVACSMGLPDRRIEGERGDTWIYDADKTTVYFLNDENDIPVIYDVSRLRGF